MPFAVFARAALVATLLAGTPPRRPHAGQVLHDQCLLNAADPKNPWALAHGLCALGATYLAADGRKATDVIVHDFLLRNQLPDGGPGPGSPYGFVRFASDGTPVEPHPNLLAKTFVLAGLPLTTKFETSWKKKITLEDLVDSVRLGFRHVPQSEDYWRDVAWTLDLLSATSRPGAQVTAQDGASVALDAVMDDALTYLEKANLELAAGLKKGLPQVDKRKQGIYAHPCGGLHLVQAVLSWARFPEVRKRWGHRVEDQLAVLIYRLDSERRQYEAALQQAPQYRLQLLVQQLKFYGHVLETLARTRAELGWKPDEPQAMAVMRGKALLDATVRDLEAVHAFEQLGALKTSQPQVYLDLIGDACHGAHGMDGWP